MSNIDHIVGQDQLGQAVRAAALQMGYNYLYKHVSPKKMQNLVINLPETWS